MLTWIIFYYVNKYGSTGDIGCLLIFSMVFDALIFAIIGDTIVQLAQCYQEVTLTRISYCHYCMIRTDQEKKNGHWVCKGWKCKGKDVDRKEAT